MPVLTKYIQGREYVFCQWRRKWVRLTPEERVRQTFLMYLVEQFNYPSSHIGVEIALPTGQRSDAIIYDDYLKPLMLIEFKAPTITLNNRTLDQAAVYNRMLKVPWLILHNGKQTLVAYINQHSIQFISHIPAYGENYPTE